MSADVSNEIEAAADEAALVRYEIDAAVAAERKRIAARMRAKRDGILLNSEYDDHPAIVALCVAGLLTELAEQLDPTPKPPP